MSKLGRISGRDQQGAIRCWAGCGLRTTRPYMIDGHPYCPDCAQEIEPKMVRAQIMADFSEWSGMSWRARSGGGPGSSRRDG